MFESQAALARPDRTHKNMAAWADAQSADRLFLSAITILELETGARLVERRDRPQRATLLRWIEEQVLPAFAGRVLAVDVDVMRARARLHVPDRRAERDALIAATASVHDHTIVTRNVADFEPMQVRLLNPWAESA